MCLFLLKYMYQKTDLFVIACMKKADDFALRIPDIEIFRRKDGHAFLTPKILPAYSENKYLFINNLKFQYAQRAERRQEKDEESDQPEQPRAAEATEEIPFAGGVGGVVRACHQHRAEECKGNEAYGGELLRARKQGECHRE